MIASNARFGVFPERIALALVVYVVLALSVPEATSTARAEGSPSMLWIRQFGTSEFDSANALAADMSGIYVAGDMGAPSSARRLTPDSFGSMTLMGMSCGRAWSATTHTPSLSAR